MDLGIRVCSCLIFFLIILFIFLVSFFNKWNFQDWIKLIDLESRAEIKLIDLESLAEIKLIVIFFRGESMTFLS